jgi:uncharacterized protein (DUF1015 family)
VPAFAPFPGLRYDTDHLDAARVTAPPYDVLDEDDRAALLAGHDRNVVRIDLPRDGEDPYAEAARTLAAWEDDGTLVRDAPAFYGYRLGHTDDEGRPRATTGVFGALELSRPGEGGILPHEHTTPKAKSDRLRLLQATHANLSAVWGLSPAATLSDLLAVPADVLADWTDEEGVHHTFWRIDDPATVAAITEAVAADPVVIADGHHRFETSLAHRDELRAASGAGDATDDLAGAGSVMVWLVQLSADQLDVQPIHRLLHGVDDPDALRAHLERSFVLEPVSGDATVAALVAEGVLRLVTPDGAWSMRPRPEVFEQVRDLDTARLDAALEGAGVELSYQHGIDLVSRRVAAGEADAGVLVRPASVDQILEIAHGGERMPPKTTFFHPKPRTGLVIRPLG